jgi:hypothetical protein
MYVVAAIGVITVVLSMIMLVNPVAWSSGILRFAAKPYFHILEILMRLILGSALLVFAGQTPFPLFISIVGGTFLLVGLGLFFAGRERHRAFAVRSSTFIKIFRPAGFVGVAFGAFVIYAAIS